jgi:predicted metal-dependent phosphoesterase TrpH
MTHHMVSDHVRIDMHVHSQYSRDSIIPIETLLRVWERSGIVPIVCDHDTITGSQRAIGTLRAYQPEIPLLYAEEISTAEGEIIGIFLTEEIPPGLSAAETLDCIHDQNGLSLVPHPFCHYRSKALKREVMDDLISRIDIIEGYNARVLSDADNEMAVAYATKAHKPLSAGSDAHIPMELGRNYLEMPPFETPEELVSSLKTASLSFTRSRSSVHATTRIVRRIRGTG